MKKIDSFLLGLFQRVSDWFHATMGVTNFTLAKLFMILAFSFLLLYKVYIQNTSFLGIFIMALTIVVYLYMTYEIKNAENSFHEKNQSLLPSFTISFYFLRYIFILCFLIVLLFSLYKNIIENNVYKTTKQTQVLFRYAYLICQLIAIYFASCRSKPKKDSILKKFLEEFSNVNVLKQKFL